MSILKYVNLFLSGFLVLFLSGCVGAREPLVPQYNTGFQKSPEWEKYNNDAIKNNSPVLDFAATTLKYKFNEGKVLSYDNFLVDDPQVTIQTKWHNCRPSDFFEFKFFMPDGRLYDYNYFKMKVIDEKYTIGRSMYIKNSFPVEIQGEWRVEIYVNSQYVLRKNFTIGAKKNYEKATPKKTIGILPFVDNKKRSTWNHGTVFSRYLGWSILAKNQNIELIPTLQLEQNLANINVDYEIFENQIQEDLLSNYSVILNTSKKYNLDYVVLGRVESFWQNSTSDTNVDVYIVDVKNKKIIERLNSLGRLYRSDYNIGNIDNVEGLHPMRAKVYNEIIKKIYPKLDSILK